MNYSKSNVGDVSCCVKVAVDPADLASSIMASFEPIGDLALAVFRIPDAVLREFMAPVASLRSKVLVNEKYLIAFA